MTSELREFALLIAALGAAGGVLLGAALWLRRSYQWWARRIERDLARIARDRAIDKMMALVPVLAEQLCVNGDEGAMPEPLRGKPLRTIVGALAAELAAHLVWARAQAARLDRIEGRQ